MHTHTSLTTGVYFGVILHPWTELSGNPNNFNVLSVSLFLVVGFSSSFDEGTLLAKWN